MFSEILDAITSTGDGLFEFSGHLIRSRVNARVQGYASNTLPFGRLWHGNPVPGRLVVQEHDAEKAGKHWDMRLVVGNRAISFVPGSSKTKIATGEKFSVGRGRMSKLIKQPDHTAKYADWEGTIEEGYGKGKVKKVFDKPILITKMNNKEMQFALDDQKVTIWKPGTKGVGPIKSAKADEWVMNASGASTAAVRPLPKGKYIVPNDVHIKALIEDGSYVAQDKIDGSNFTLVISKDGSKHLISHHKSVNGGFIDRKMRVPEKLFDNLPNGTIIQGEVWHPKGPYVTASILNANPLTAYLKQKQLGLLRFTAWDVAKIRGRDISKQPFARRRELLVKLGKESGVDVVRQHEVPNMPALKRALHGSIRRYGEGLVLKKLDMEYGGNPPMVKVKPTHIIKATIERINNGNGRLSNSMGALTVKTEDGKKCQVGSGFTDVQRDYIWKNRHLFKGQMIEVEYLDQTQESLRAPRFHRLSPTQATVDMEKWPR